MSITAKGPPYVIGGEDFSALGEYRSAAVAAVKPSYVVDTFDDWDDMSSQTRLAREVADRVVYKPAIPEVDERHRREVSPTLEELTKIVRGEKLEWKKIDTGDSTQVGGTHYSEMNIQPWEAIYAWMSPEEVTGYHLGTVIGYISRHKKKGQLQDLKKAEHHLRELIRYLTEEEEYPW